MKYLLANALQLNSAFSTARKKIEKQSFQFFYVPYEPLSTDVQDSYVQEIETLIKLSKIDESVNYSSLILILVNIFTFVKTISIFQIKLCYEWINKSLQGIDYFNTYYKLPLLFCVTSVGLGWIVLLILETNSLKQCRKINRFYKLLINASFLAAAASSSFFISGKLILRYFAITTQYSVLNSGVHKMVYPKVVSIK